MKETYQRTPPIYPQLPSLLFIPRAGVLIRPPVRQALSAPRPTQPRNSRRNQELTSTSRTLTPPAMLAVIYEVCVGLGSMRLRCALPQYLDLKIYACVPRLVVPIKSNPKSLSTLDQSNQITASEKVISFYI